ncbi:MAG TPA: hypothetical protein VF459_11660 [Caulobacteraceae bacterium]
MTRAPIIASALAAVSVLALAACSRSGDLNHGGSVSLDGGKTVVSKRLPTDLPSYVKVYPGAVVTAVVDNKDQGGLIAYDVSDPPETVMDFYKKSASDAKFTTTTDSWSLNQDHNGAHVIMWNGAETKRSMMTTVEVKDGKTHVGVMYGAS